MTNTNPNKTKEQGTNYEGAQGQQGGQGRNPEGNQPGQNIQGGQGKGQATGQGSSLEVEGAERGGREGRTGQRPGQGERPMKKGSDEEE